MASFRILRTHFLQKRILDSTNVRRRIPFSTAQPKAEDDGMNNESRGAENESDFSVKETKELILNAALGFVDRYGWSNQALAAGAESIGLSQVSHGMFPEGGSALVLHFYSSCNDKLIELLQTDSKQKMPRPVFLSKAVENRLRMICPYKKHWPQAMGLMAMPQNILPALNNITTLVDNILFHAGDRSVGFDWYTNRVALAAVYKSTELVFIQDESADFVNTWSFLQSRIQNWQAMSQLNDNSKKIFTTMQNILGFQSINR